MKTAVEALNESMEFLRSDLQRDAFLFLSSFEATALRPDSTQEDVLVAIQSWGFNVSNIDELAEYVYHDGLN